ncbi:protein-L-isoaspartate O-methyltransferase family protein [Prosthecodimorpha staleyi]|uniref:Protein-L-isoaspartate O-methyltransferase n=1 Tax=Prosthecodimorpha staleyi TaxID=2840188 RepID=A0A947GBJ6_9HYPH|nr:protein-L-isoaspartate O-methyltransferase [Prosthecodimorpha staleyi]MBT9288126.1 protein-L-isoaspartate O-methyltransferase [Prosthecodimorpha staleyi]
MTDWATARRTMVDNQVRTNDVTDLGVIDAMMAVPRELFVPGALRSLAYIDEHMQVKPGNSGAPSRFLMQPAPLAKLVQLAEIGPGDKVLVVGASTGYAAALVAGLAATVVALEEDADLAAEAGRTLAGLGLDNVKVVVGRLSAGAPAEAPFDVILFDGAIESLPAAFAGQLAEGGRLVAIEGYGLAGRAKLYRSTSGTLSGRASFNAAARPLPGFEKAAEFVF